MGVSDSIVDSPPSTELARERTRESLATWLAFMMKGQCGACSAYLPSLLVIVSIVLVGCDLKTTVEFCTLSSECLIYCLNPQGDFPMLAQIRGGRC